MSIVRSQVLKEWFVEDDHYLTHTINMNWTPLTLANGWPIIRRFGSLFEKMEVKLYKDLCEKPHYLIWSEKLRVEKGINSLLMK